MRIVTVVCAVICLVALPLLANAEGSKDLDYPRPQSADRGTTSTVSTLDFSESFEGSFPPAGWTTANPDGGSGWAQLAAGTTPLPGWTGGLATVPPGGGSFIAYCTYNTGGAVSNDQWLISPQLQNIQSGASLMFWMEVQYSASYNEHVEILLSTTGTNPADFTTTIDVLDFVGADSPWTLYSYDLTLFAAPGSDVYVAFREMVADNFAEGAFVALDLVSGVSVPVELQAFSVE